MNTRAILISILSILLFVCSCDKEEDEPTAQPTIICFTDIGKGSLYGGGEEGIAQSNIVITNTTDWQNLMNQMDSVNSVTDQFTETNIDFGNEMIIAVFLDVKENGWEVQLTDILENANNIVVSKSETEFVNSVINQPFHIVKIPKTSKPIIFE
ncbi:MAG: protease complex subunit PrcB family protein [Salinivirgaceae bacterium]|nr:protease complex subunit PrcB family protein [Salinivirgaceae bacterium]